jgi:transcriptional regulator with XRE-family HTH domain
MSRRKSPQLGIFLGTGERIRKIRGELTQEKFGRLFGVKGNTVSRWEDGRLSDEETLKKIADYGRVTIEWLLYGDRINFLDQVLDETQELMLRPDTPVEVKDGWIRGYLQTARALREQLSLARLKIADLEQLQESITIESPREASVLSQPYLFGALDIDALTQIIEAAEALLQKRQKPLKPVKKALLLSLLYDHWQTTGRIPDQTVIQEFLRRVA